MCCSVCMCLCLCLLRVKDKLSIDKMKIEKKISIKNRNNTEKWSAFVKENENLFNIISFVKLLNCHFNHFVIEVQPGFSVIELKWLDKKLNPF